MTVGVVTIPIVTPINALPIINSMKKSVASCRLENPMIIQEIVAMKLISKRVYRRPILSEIYPDKRLPMGHVIAVIDANHEISDAFKVTSLSDCDKSCVVIAG